MFFFPLLHWDLEMYRDNFINSVAHHPRMHSSLCGGKWNRPCRGSNSRGERTSKVVNAKTTVERRKVEYFIQLLNRVCFSAEEAFVCQFRSPTALKTPWAEGRLTSAAKLAWSRRPRSDMKGFCTPLTPKIRLLRLQKVILGIHLNTLSLNKHTIHLNNHFGNVLQCR